MLPVQGMGLRPLTCWMFVRISPAAWKIVSCDFCMLYVVNTSGRSLVQTSPTKCGVSNECDRETPQGKDMNRNRVEEPRWGEGWDIYTHLAKNSTVKKLPILMCEERDRVSHTHEFQVFLFKATYFLPAQKG